jgi:hypothetical protein
VDKLFGITDVVMIGDRLSTILAEARNKTDVRLQVDFGISEDGVPVERYIAVVQVGPGHRQRFDISERDFKFLRWTGTDVEIVACPKAYRALNSCSHLMCVDLEAPEQQIDIRDHTVLAPATYS